jgi:tetratricopeptide (TPR) repeat protein
MAREPAEIAEQRRTLGEHLVTFRRAADLTQGQLAQATVCHRTQVAHVEKGRSRADERFWRGADQACNAGGALLAAFHELQIAKAEHEQHRRDQELADVQQRADALRRGRGALTVRDNAVGRAPTEQPATASDVHRWPVRVTSTQLDVVVEHLRDQWHLLVKTDNLLGPRYALRGVLDQLTTIDGLLGATDVAARREVVRLGAQYAESASWLYEDSGDLTAAQHWNHRAMEWAHEADDSLMVAWTLFRRSQQAVSSRNAAQVISLAQTAERVGGDLPPPMRAAIAQQEAVGHAMAMDEPRAWSRFDDAEGWATTNDDGDARGGHGSFCTTTYLTLQRAGSWLVLGRPDRAVRLFEEALPEVPNVYRRDRGWALCRLASAHAQANQPEQAARVAVEALEIARSAGSARTVHQVRAVGHHLVGHRRLAPVAELLTELTAAGTA